VILRNSISEFGPSNEALANFETSSGYIRTEKRSGALKVGDKVDFVGV